MKLTLGVRSILLYLLLAALVTAPAWPQASTASVRGTVQDQCAGWSIDTGEVSPASTDAVADVIRVLSAAF